MCYTGTVIRRLTDITVTVLDGRAVICTVHGPTLHLEPTHARELARHLIAAAVRVMPDEMVQVPRAALNFVLDHGHFADEGPYGEGWKSIAMERAIKLLEEAVEVDQ